MGKYFLKKQNKKSLVGWQAVLMSLGTFSSRILGLLRDVSISTFFSKTETDIFFVAFRFPNFFRRLLGEGSFSASVTPILTEILEKKGKQTVKDAHSRLFTLLFCLSCFLTVLGVLFMEDLMNLFFADSAYARTEGKLEKTVIVGRLVFTYLFFVSLYSYFMSVAQVFGRFFLPALAPAFFNLSLIVFAWSPQSWWPFPALSLAWAVILGGMLQLIPVLYEMRRLELFPRFSSRLNSPLVIQAGKRFLPGMLGLSGLSLIGLINVYFAGWLEEGAPSYIYYGDRLLEFPRALIAVSIGTALIPELTRLYSLEKFSDFKNTASHYLRFLLFLTLPCSLVFLLSAEPIIELIFGRGEFDDLSVSKTSKVLRIYSVVLIFSSLSRVLSSCFFAVNKNWHIVICALVFVCFHALCARFLTPAYGLKGLVGATALSSVFYFILLTGFVSDWIGGLNFKKTFMLLIKSIPGLILLGLCLMSQPYLFSVLSSFLFSLLSLLISLFVVFFAGGGFYILSALFLKEEMAVEFLNLFQKFFIKRKVKIK